MKGGLTRRSGLVFADDERAESACGRVRSQRAECVWGLSVGSSARGALLFTEEQREEKWGREREGGLEEEGSEGYATDRKKRGGGVYLRRNSTPPLGLFPGLGAITFFICAYMSMCVCVQARHCACLDVCKPVYINECRSVLRLTARREDKSKTRERELKNARKQLAHTAVY